MPRFVWMGIFLGSLLLAVPLIAQDDTATEEPTSTVSYFFIACDNQAVLDLEGIADVGDDLYVQVFEGLGATGNPLTPLVRVPVDGEYQISQVLAYSNDTVLALGQFASATIAIGSETDSTDLTFEEVVDDGQDGCVSPTFPTTDNITTGGIAAAPTAIPPLFTGGNTNVPADFSVFDTLRALEAANQIVEAQANAVANVSGLGSDIGLTSVQLFTGSNILPNERIQEGADPGTIQSVPSSTSDGILTQAVNFQQAILTNVDPAAVSPNVVFAECDAFDGTGPSVIGANSTVVVYWAWFATSRDLLAQHNNAAQYSVFLTSNAGRQLIQNVFATDPILLADGNFYTIYAASLGGFPAGNYRIEYNVSWRTPINDGIEDFGPGTERPAIQNSCTFSIGAGGGSSIVAGVDDLLAGGASAGAAATNPVVSATDSALNAAITFQTALTAETLEAGTGRRTTSPGVIFAECDDIPGTSPGIVFDNETLIVYWAWFARTSDQLAQHSASARYQVFITDAAGNRRLIQNAQVAAPRVLADGNIYLVYAADIGTLPAGSARVDYDLSWSTAISDGFEDFGPGTANPSITSSCSFTVTDA